LKEKMGHDKENRAPLPRYGTDGKMEYVRNELDGGGGRNHRSKITMQHTERTNGTTLEVHKCRCARWKRVILD
jgi:hypothetical protein